MTHWKSYLADHQSRFLEELLDFIRIPSISALPEHAADVQQAGKWVANRLQAAGIENVVVMPTGGRKARGVMPSGFNAIWVAEISWASRPGRQKIWKWL